MKNLKWFDSTEDAVKAGEDEDSLVTLHYRNPREKAALELAVQFGNRDQRRLRKYRPHLAYGTEALQGGDLTRIERDRRNAARRLAKKQRKRNRRG